MTLPCHSSRGTAVVMSHAGSYSSPANHRERPVRLLLLRHAKSDWSGNLGDHDRPLAPRGRKATPRIGACMRKRGYVPAAVVCSTAERTKETLELLLPAL